MQEVAPYMSTEIRELRIRADQLQDYATDVDKKRHNARSRGLADTEFAFSPMLPRQPPPPAPDVDDITGDPLELLPSIRSEAVR